MQVFYTDRFTLPLPQGHRFPSQKYRLLRERVTNASWILGHQLVEPEAISREDLVRVHDGAYVDRVLCGQLSATEVRRIGFPWSEAMVERSLRATGATYMATIAALRDGRSVTLAGGTHHACIGHGEGYCVFNDCAVSALAMHARGVVRRVLVIDLDVHQGNGTADIMRHHEWCYTFSMHAAKNYPFRKIASDCDIEFADGTGDDEYLSTLHTALDYVWASSRPDVVYYLAGADPFKGDSLGRLALTKQGLLARDQMVIHRAHQEGVPLVVTMAGGYGIDILDTVDIHYHTVMQVVTQ
ncbi:MAG: histone deacetylase [Roseiflexaceae bacterium]